MYIYFHESISMLLDISSTFFQIMVNVVFTFEMKECHLEPLLVPIVQMVLLSSLRSVSDLDCY